MAWFGRSKGRAAEQTHQKYVKLFGFVADLLRLEADLIASLGKLNFEDENKVINGPALGYLYGFADAAMHTAGLALANENGRMLLAHLYEAYAPGSGEQYLRYMVQNISRDEISSAVKDGGETYLRWAKSQGKVMPWGLGKYLGMRRGERAGQ